MEDDPLRSQIESWCSRNRVRYEKQNPPVQGLRYEIYWNRDNGIVEFIDVYPRGDNRVLVQRGAYAAEQVPVREEERFKGPLLVRRWNDLNDLLTRLKQHSDTTSARDLREQVSSQAAATRG